MASLDVMLTQEYWSEASRDMLIGWIRRARQDKEQKALDRRVVRALRNTNHYRLHSAHRRADAFTWTIDADEGYSVASELPRAYRAVLDEVRRGGHLNNVTLASDPLRIEIARSEPQPLWLADRIDAIAKWPQNEFLFSPGMTPTVNGHSLRQLRLTDPKIAQMMSAGGTGSGKTTLGFNVLLTLAMTTSPALCRILIVDPKQVDMSNSDLQRLPHLMMPVVTDPREAISAVMLVRDEMQRRIDSVRAANASGRRWTVTDRIFLYVDELFHLVQESKAIQEPLAWIAAEGRGVGVHLMLSTQRPTVDIVNGHIRSNVPCRFAGWVRSAEESKIATGLPENRAERLFGNGHFILVIRSQEETLHSYAIDIHSHVPKIVDKIIKRWGNTRTLPLTPTGDNCKDNDALVDNGCNSDQAIVAALLAYTKGAGGGEISLNAASEVAKLVTGKGLGRERAKKLIEMAKEGA